MTAAVTQRACWACRRGWHIRCAGPDWCGCDIPHGPAATGPVSSTKCKACDKRVQSGADYHPDCVPWVCECDTPAPDGLGECGHCHRLCLTHSWHNGRPTTTTQPAAH